MTCLLCGSDRLIPWVRGFPRLGYSEPTRFGISGCASCGLRQTRPIPSPEEVQEAYGSTYTWHDDGSLVTRVERAYRRLLVRCDQLRVLSRAARLAGAKAVLDLGCADGLIVAEARRIGLHAFGLDRPDAPLWPGCDPSWRLAGDIERFTQPAESWNVISMFHVLEHVSDPLELLRKVRPWLLPGGLLVLQVPNAGSFEANLFRKRWYGFDIPRHLTHWSAKTLREALRRAGYEIVAVRHLSLRDNGPCLVSSLMPGLDPLVERERVLAGAPSRGSVEAIARRAFFFLAIWAALPITLGEAMLGRAPTITVLARPAPGRL